MPDYKRIGIEITGYQCILASSINYEAKERHPSADTKVYQSQTFLEVTGNCCDTDREYLISIHPRREEELNSTVDEYKALNKKGEPRYRTAQGLKTTIYEAPSSIGYMESNRTGAVWIDPHQIKDMLCLLPVERSLYASIQEYKGKHGRLVSHFSIQNVHPDII
jgi:hypothetical protein